MNKNDLNKKTLAILMFVEKDGQDDDVYVLSGVVELLNDELYLNSGPKRPPFLIQEEWFDRIKPTPEEFVEEFSNAELYLSLSVGSLPENADMMQYNNTGLNLHSRDE
ncbi:hypothetical protein QQ056_16930 [Oscillatoria laete-virens NRMC-F 0139]|nr:hypothetical protein [Oscillatoria laete-virens]MDL5055218.1 hypothetical protein [Oscillatoria laete-virens NRMC-F 0139]